MGYRVTSWSPRTWCICQSQQDPGWSRPWFAAGALIAWALGITELDPLEHGLIFERFLNPDRVSMPDIDMDFDERRRGEMIRATEKYGDDQVAQIVTPVDQGQGRDQGLRAHSAAFTRCPTRSLKTMPDPVMGKDICCQGIFDPKHPGMGRRKRTSATARRGPAGAAGRDATAWASRA